MCRARGGEAQAAQPVEGRGVRRNAVPAAREVRQAVRGARQASLAELQRQALVPQPARLGRGVPVRRFERSRIGLGDEVYEPRHLFARLLPVQGGQARRASFAGRRAAGKKNDALK